MDWKKGKNLIQWVDQAVEEQALVLTMDLLAGLARVLLALNRLLHHRALDQDLCQDQDQIEVEVMALVV
jgi:hypothetical protein